jgi:hypothetical protein
LTERIIAGGTNAETEKGHITTAIMAKELVANAELSRERQMYLLAEKRKVILDLLRIFSHSVNP